MGSLSVYNDMAYQTSPSKMLQALFLNNYLVPFFLYDLEYNFPDELFTENFETETVNFKAGPAANYIKPGDIVKFDGAGYYATFSSVAANVVTTSENPHNLLVNDKIFSLGKTKWDKYNYQFI